MDDTCKILGLYGLAVDLGLPVKWLRAEAEAERIPSLRIGHRRLFDPDAVRRALAARAAQGPQDNVK